LLQTRVARLFIFKPKIPIWVKIHITRALDGKILIYWWPFEIIYEHLGHFVNILLILCSFGTFFPVSVSCTKKNLATLLQGSYFFMTQYTLLLSTYVHSF
jgi:hypothetical protein